MASTTLSFSSNDDAWASTGIAHDGQGGSVDIPWLDLQIMSIGDVSGTVTGHINWMPASWLLSSDPGYSGLTEADNDGTKGMAIKAGDGTNFSLESFRYYNWGETEASTNTVIGYRDGIQVATYTFDAYDDNYTPTIVNLGVAFNNVDDVRIFISGGGYRGDQSLSNHSINDIVINSAGTAPSFVIALSNATAAQNSGPIDLASLLAVNDPDPGQTLTWSQFSGPSHGALAISGATASSGSTGITPGGTITYTPVAGFAGTDMFTIQVYDGTATATRTVTVHVTPSIPGAPDMAAVSDTGLFNNDNITAANNLTFSGTSAAGDSSSTVRLFIDENNNQAYDAGESSATATLGNGAWTVSNLTTVGLDGTYNIYAYTTSANGNLTSSLSSALQIQIDHTTPDTVFTSLSFSNDTGISNSDFVTGASFQTIAATLSTGLIQGDVVWGSTDNGATWTNITSNVSDTTLTWPVTLLAGGKILMYVADEHDNRGVTTAINYTLDTTAPTTGIATAAFSADANGNFVVNQAQQTLSGTLDANLLAGDIVEVSIDNGASWEAATSTAGRNEWSLSGIELTRSDTLKVRVADMAGNHGGIWSQDFELDTAAPLAGAPVRSDLVDVSGTDFTFTMTYTDSGTGIDTSTFGVGNVTVTGPAGSLNVTGYSANGNTVTYIVTAPGGSWDPLDSGSYTIGINGQVTDLAGNVVAANTIAHDFLVRINNAPALAGVFATPTIDDNATTAPFAGVTVSDADGDQITLSIQYTAANGTLSGPELTGSAGNYTLDGSAIGVQAALRALVFTPTENQISTGTASTTFTLTVSDDRATASSNATVVTTTPVAPAVTTILLSDQTLNAGETATLSVTFSEAVTGFTADDLILSGGAIDQLGSSDGGRTWITTFTPTAGLAMSGHQVLLDMSGVQDGGGLAGSGVSIGPSYTVSTVRPTATLHLDDTTLTSGETATLTIEFSEAVSGFADDDLSTPHGILTDLASINGGVTWTATFTPDANTSVSGNMIVLDLGGVVNAAGNAGLGNAQSGSYSVGTALPVTPDPDPVKVIGTPGERNVFEDLPGPQQFVGSDKLDQVILSLSRSSYQIELGPDGLPEKIIGPDGTDTLEGVERLTFSDGTLAFDFDGMAGQSYRLYQAAFDRAPDTPGLGYWIRHLDAEKSDVRAVAESFIKSPEFIGLYGTEDTIPDAEYIRLLYINGLSREPDEEGFDYWVDKLTNGQTDRADLLVFFSDSIENRDAVRADMAHGIWYV